LVPLLFFSHDKYIFAFGMCVLQPRVFMAMARDGLLPAFFSDIHMRTQIPLKSTIVTGLFAAVLAFFMDVSQLAGMVSFVLTWL
jgi:solute carrier family 7 (cationic amino acid transporter), member 1